jgi:hypothetical protein
MSVDSADTAWFLVREMESYSCSRLIMRYASGPARTATMLYEERLRSKKEIKNGTQK